MLKSLCAAVSLLALVNAASASTVSMDDKVALQAVMASYIESHLVDGIIPHVLLDKGEVVSLVPTKAHPMILTMGDDYVLCTDFRAEDGTFVNVDFYVARAETGFVIYQTEIGNRAPLEKMMEAGKVAMSQ